MAFFTRLQERLAAVSAISSATTASAMPFFGVPVWTPILLGRAPAALLIRDRYLRPDPTRLAAR
jgi:hypothetical protein